MKQTIKIRYSSTIIKAKDRYGDSEKMRWSFWLLAIRCFGSKRKDMLVVSEKICCLLTKSCFGY